MSNYWGMYPIIHLEIDPAEINKNVYAHYPILGDCKESLKILTSKVSKNNHDEWLVSFEKKMKIEIDAVIKNDTKPVKKGLTMGEVIVSINKYTKGDAEIGRAHV